MHRVIRRAALRRGLLLWGLVRVGTLVVVAIVASAGTVSLAPDAMAGMAPAVLIAIAAVAVWDELLIRREGTLLANLGSHRFTVVSGVILVAAVLEGVFVLAMVAIK